MSPADRLLSAATGVLRTGPGRWSAICPAHPDRRPSLSVRELDDGKLLIRCWAGCDAAAITGALGLELADLFPNRRDQSSGRGAPRERRPWAARDLLRVAAFEVTVAVVVASDLLAGRPADRERLLQAAQALIGLVGALDDA
jgi:hypothetical protein